VNSLPKTVTRQRHDCDLNPGPSVPEFSTLTARLPSHPVHYTYKYTQLSVRTKSETYNFLKVMVSSCGNMSAFVHFGVLLLCKHKV